MRAASTPAADRIRRVGHVTPRPLSELVDPGWATALAPVADRVTERSASSCERRSPLAGGTSPLGTTCFAPSRGRWPTCAS